MLKVKAYQPKTPKTPRLLNKTITHERYHVAMTFRPIYRARLHHLSNRCGPGYRQLFGHTRSEVETYIPALLLASVREPRQSSSTS